MARHENRMSAESAIACIQDYGGFAAMTADGLIAVAAVTDPSHDDDDSVDETTVFPVVCGFVCGRAIRHWLGYRSTVTKWRSIFSPMA